MGLQERTYSALVVSAADAFNAAIPSFFPKAKFNAVTLADSANLAKRILAERAYDFVVVNSPLPDGDGARLVVDACETSASVALILARPDAHAALYERVAPKGVFTLQKPVAASTMALAIRWMAAARERLRKSEKKAVSIEEKMELIRLVNRAKWLLIQELKMTEPDAHRYIEKQAMDRCVSKEEVAKEIVSTYS